MSAVPKGELDFDPGNVSGDAASGDRPHRAAPAPRADPRRMHVRVGEVQHGREEGLEVGARPGGEIDDLFFNKLVVVGDLQGFTLGAWWPGEPCIPPSQDDPGPFWKAGPPGARRGEGARRRAVKTYPLVRDVSDTIVALQREGIGDVQLFRRRNFQADSGPGRVQDFLVGDGDDLPVPSQHDPAVPLVRMRIPQKSPCVLFGQELVGHDRASETDEDGVVGPGKL